MSVAVVGSLNEDVLVAVDRLPGRGETVIARSTALAPGGKGANQAAAAGRLGAGVAMVGRVGDDPAGRRQIEALRAAGIDVAHVRRTAGVPTGSATIPVEDGTGENLIVVVPGANGRLAPEDVVVGPVREAAVVLLQLEVPIGTVQAAAVAARGLVVLTPAPPRPLPAGLLDRVDVLVPNEHELLSLAGAPPGERSPAELAALAKGVARAAVVVTLGARGALVVPAHDGAATLHAPPPVDPVDTTGAGDCFTGALGHALAAGAGRGDPLRGGRRGAVHHGARCTRCPARRRRRPGPPATGAGGEHRGRGSPPGDAGTGPASRTDRGDAMTDPEQPAHTAEPAEGPEAPGDQPGGRTPHPDQPAEGADTAGDGAHTPDA